MDDRFLYRKLVANNKTTELLKTPHNLGKQEYLTCTLEIRLSANRIVHLLNQGGKWDTLDDWSDPAGNFTQGSFGLLIRGRDEVGLSNFAFQPAK
jgi:hypothetical protein